jgi:hypothetical protein
MTSILPFVPFPWSMATGMLVCTIYTIICLLTRPFVRSADDRLHLWCQIELLLMLTMGWVMNSEGAPSPDSSTDVALSVVMIAATCVLIVVFAAHVFVHVRKFYRSAQRAQAKAKRLQELVRVHGMCFLLI